MKQEICITVNLKFRAYEIKLFETEKIITKAQYRFDVIITMSSSPADHPVDSVSQNIVL